MGRGGEGKGGEGKGGERKGGEERRRVGRRGKDKRRHPCMHYTISRTLLHAAHSRHEFKHDTPDAPHVHLVGVVAVR